MIVDDEQAPTAGFKRGGRGCASFGGERGLLERGCGPQFDGAVLRAGGCEPLPGAVKRNARDRARGHLEGSCDRVTCFWLPELDGADTGAGRQGSVGRECQCGDELSLMERSSDVARCSVKHLNPAVGQADGEKFPGAREREQAIAAKPELAEWQQLRPRICSPDRQIREGRGRLLGPLASR